ncbi:hypothetical protein EVAR_45764_1 [Eumeta japonica]|uniref:Uncharacterized protein n=1 Tax=Eumeta variegata TaxID=151549 RepID=A0A4C1YZ95_EUMVA|nr:hypothetical protein EVAR_45764_1 [Eumeta japonica]
MDRIMKVLKYTKVEVATGYDEASSEMLKSGGDIVAILLYQLFNKFWKSHRIPNDWCKAVIALLYKGKDLGRFVNKTENKIYHVQVGFRKWMKYVDVVEFGKQVTAMPLAPHSSAAVHIPHRSPAPRRSYLSHQTESSGSEHTIASAGSSACVDIE